LVTAAEGAVCDLAGAVHSEFGNKQPASRLHSSTGPQQHNNHSAKNLNTKPWTLEQTRRAPQRLDLFFVAAISNLSHLFKEHPDAGNAGAHSGLVPMRWRVGSQATTVACTAGCIVLYHALVFFLWAEYTMLKTRFK
jgi:hypothetical protein